MKTSRSNANQQERSDQTRRKILHAAVQEFSAHGLAGSRTDAIARSARVNKALLYYYFKSKEALYTATIEDMVGNVMKSTNALLEQRCTPGEHLLRLALNHFDRILTQPDFQSLMQQEMIRFRSGKTTALPIIARTAFAPLLARVHKTVSKGVREGELVPLDWMQVLYSGFGANVFYFLSAPMMRVALAADSFEPFALTTLSLRRKSAMQFLASALFVDRAQGYKIARRVLASIPTPDADLGSQWRRQL
jgi:TetR/AcrR family transcriptional regulator